MKNKFNGNEELLTNVYVELAKTDRDKTITKSLIEDVVFNGQFKFVAHTMKKGMFETVTLKYFGKFKARHAMIQKMFSKLTNKK